MSASRSCRLCGGQGLDTIYRAVPTAGGSAPTRFDIDRCRACGLEQTMPSPEADDLRRLYEASSYTWTPSAGLLGRLEATYRRTLVRVDQVAVLERACRRVGRRDVLDVGCGDGIIVATARGAGMNAYGVDYPGTPLWPGCDPSWKRGADLETLSEPDERWDVVSMFHVLEHLRDPVGMLRRMRAWLRADGRLVVQVPNIGSLQGRACGPGWFGLDVPRHLSHFTPATLRRALEHGGWAVEEIRHISMRDSGPLLASSLLPHLDPRIERERPQAGSPLLRRLAYLAVAWGSTPLVLFETLLRRGATITAIARKA